MKDYFQPLQRRSKWFKEKDVAVGKVVVFLDDSKKERGKFALARIVGIKEGRDSIIRTVRIRLPNGKELTRPLHLLAPLEIEE